MRKWIDEETGAKMCEPDCTDEWLFNIRMLGFDYDGCHTVEEFKQLIDELVEMSKKARECLWDFKLFGEHGTPFKKSHWIMERYVEEMADKSALNKLNNVKFINIPLVNAVSYKEIEDSLKDINVFENTIKMMKGEINNESFKND